MRCANCAIKTKFTRANKDHTVIDLNIILKNNSIRIKKKRHLSLFVNIVDGHYKYYSTVRQVWTIR